MGKVMSKEPASPASKAAAPLVALMALNPKDWVEVMGVARKASGSQMVPTSTLAKPGTIGQVSRLIKDGDYSSMCITEVDGTGVWGVDSREPIFRRLTPAEIAPLAAKLAVRIAANFDVYIGSGSGLKVGCDPEVFVLDKGGAVIPAFEFLQSKKLNSQFYWDGFQAELTINPNTCHEVHLTAVRQRLSQILAAARAKFPDATLTYHSVMQVPELALKEGKKEHVELGCAPSLNAYPDTPAIDVGDSRLLPYRFAGYHIHHGYPTKLTEEAAIPIVKAMDAITGIISVSVLDGLENPLRRRFYGRAGEFRLPPHGLEYRVMSSAMLAHPIIAFLLLDLTRYAGKIAEYNILDKVWESPGDAAVQAIINNYDVAEARRVISANSKTVRKMLSALYGGYNASASARLFENLIMKGAKTCLPIGDDIAKIWGISPQGIQVSEFDMPRARNFVPYVIKPVAL